jgi:DNA-directed RNA polymerase sigma subunit (sigma70/sigma32)
MRWYSHPTYKFHMQEMKKFKDEDAIKAQFIEWPRSIANSFNRSYSRIGVLDLNDLLQEGYYSFYKAWNNLDWDLINNSVPEERNGIIINYLKLNIKNGIKRAIAKDRDTIRIPEAYYNLRPHGDAYNGKYDDNYQIDIFLTKTFSSFFNNSYLDIMDEVPDYNNEQLNLLLNDIFDKILTSFERDVLKKSFGIDEAYDKPQSIKGISEWFNKSVIWIKKTKARALDKLKEEEITEVIERFLEK